MAKQILLLDDLTGEADAASVTFALYGQIYDIDLSPASQAKLEKALKPFIDKATPRGTTRTNGNGAAELATIRAWARVHGWPDLGDRGRIPQEAMDAYRAAENNG